MARVYSIEKVKNLFARVSLTNQYKLEIKVDDRIRKFINNEITGRDGIPTGPEGIYGKGDSAGFGGLDEKVSVMCRSTQIPGLGFEFETLNGARQGISEIFPTYRRYTAFDCTFFVDRDHDVLRFFNRWLNMISPLRQSSGTVSPPLTRTNEGRTGIRNGTGISDRANFYQMKYKDDYVCDITLTKFEKDSFGPDNKWRPEKTKDTYEVSDGLVYTFHRAFPVEVTPTPLSYDNPDILQVNVTFEYERYSVS